jgi:hypothetical protein
MVSVINLGSEDIWLEMKRETVVCVFGEYGQQIWRSAGARNNFKSCNWPKL